MNRKKEASSLFVEVSSAEMSFKRTCAYKIVLLIVDVEEDKNYPSLGLLHCIGGPKSSIVPTEVSMSEFERETC